MPAQKIRYEEPLIADEEPENSTTPSPIPPTSWSETSYAPSPARQLQQQLEDQFGDAAAAKPAEKYSGLLSILIIIGSSAVLWAGLFTLGLAIYQ